jgi:hypothetical protein
VRALAGLDGQPDSVSVEHARSFLCGERERRGWPGRGLTVPRPGTNGLERGFGVASAAANSSGARPTCTWSASLVSLVLGRL